MGDRSNHLERYAGPEIFLGPPPRAEIVPWTPEPQTGWSGLLRNILASAMTGNFLSPRGDIRGDIGDYMSMMGRNVARDLREIATTPESIIGTGTLGAPLGIFAGPAARRTTQWALSPNRATAPGRFNYGIIRDNGEPGGSLSGHILDDGQTAFISWIGRTGQENELGPSALRDLFHAFRRDFPNVTNFAGTRNSGARARARWESGRDISGGVNIRVPDRLK